MDNLRPFPRRDKLRPNQLNLSIRAPDEYPVVHDRLGPENVKDGSEAVEKPPQSWDEYGSKAELWRDHNKDGNVAGMWKARILLFNKIQPQAWSFFDLTPRPTLSRECVPASIFRPQRLF